MIDSWGIDGDVLQIVMPTKEEVSKLVAASEEKYRTHLVLTCYMQKMLSAFQIRKSILDKRVWNSQGPLLN
uniref:Uncharacterized protein n=1 Tax=Rhizophora mucronata TaxID=61149 RepID=A0A2P2IUQ9_RHIMU